MRLGGPIWCATLSTTLPMENAQQCGPTHGHLRVPPRSRTTHRVHGLPFEDPPEENARPLDNLKGDVLELYEQSRTPEQLLVAYKGGHVERNLLRELDLPATNLEHAGCPKFERLEIYPIQDCGQHRTRGHCAMVECQAFWQWMKPDSDPWGPDSGGSEQLRMARRPWLLDRK